MSREVDRYVKKLSEDQQKIFERLRKFLLGSFPDIKEELRGNCPRYEPIAWMIATDDHIALGIIWGALLKNPPSYVEGSGKGERQIKIRTLDDVKLKEFEILFKTARARYEDLQNDLQRTR